MGETLDRSTKQRKICQPINRLASVRPERLPVNAVLKPSFRARISSYQNGDIMLVTQAAVDLMGPDGPTSATWFGRIFITQMQNPHSYSSSTFTFPIARKSTIFC